MKTSYLNRSFSNRSDSLPLSAQEPVRKKRAGIPAAVLLAFMLVALGALPAHANNPPGTVGEVLFAYLIPIAMIMLTMLAGGYTIINRLKPPAADKKSKVVSYLKTAAKTVFWLFIIIWSLAFAGMSLLLCLAFGIYAIYRSGQLIRWGMIARRTVGKPDYLHDARPARLISSGCALAVITVIMSLLTLVFVQHGTAYGTGGYMLRLEKTDLKNMVALETKRLELARDKKRNRKELENLDATLASQKEKIRDSRRRYIVEPGKDGKSFTVFLLPAKESLIFTYPSHRADVDAEGRYKIRRAWVSGINQRCPEDAAVIGEGP